VGNGDVWDVTERVVPGWTTLAECPVFEICVVLSISAFTPKVSLASGCCTREKLSHAPMEGTDCAMASGEAGVKGSCSSGAFIPEEGASSTSPPAQASRGTASQGCARVSIPWGWSCAAAGRPEDHIDVGPRTCQALPGW